MNVGSAYVQAAAVVCALLGLSFGWVRIRHADPGSGWFALGYLAVFATFAINASHPPDPGHTNRAASMTNVLAMLALCAGLVDYVGLRGAVRWKWRLILPSPMLLGLLWLPFGGMSRAFTQLSISGSLLLMAWLTWHASTTQKQVNLSLVIGALLLQPAMAATMLILGIDLYQLTSIVIIPVALFGMTLFAVSLTRARVLMEEAMAARDAGRLQLEQLNESLEARVEQRTVGASGSHRRAGGVQPKRVPRSARPPGRRRRREPAGHQGAADRRQGPCPQKAQPDRQAGRPVGRPGPGTSSRWPRSGTPRWPPAWCRCRIAWGRRSSN